MRVCTIPLDSDSVLIRLERTMAKNATKQAILISGPDAADWTETEISGDLKSMQSAVQGYIERVPLKPQIPGVDVWVNEDGLSMQFPPNARWVYEGKDAGVLVGPILITFGGKGRTPERVAKVKEAIKPLIP